MDLSRLKMVNIRVGLFAAGMWKEVTVGDSQRTIISYLETLSVTQLDGQEPALTQAVWVSFNRHAVMYVTSLCSLSLKIQKYSRLYCYCSNNVTSRILVVLLLFIYINFLKVQEIWHVCFVKSMTKTSIYILSAVIPTKHTLICLICECYISM